MNKCSNCTHYEEIGNGSHGICHINDYNPPYERDIYPDDDHVTNEVYAANKPFFIERIYSNIVPKEFSCEAYFSLNGDADFIKEFVDPTNSSVYFQCLLELTKWYDTLKNNQGEDVRINRKMAYVYDKPVIYKYANLELPGTTWMEHPAADVLLKLRKMVENYTSMQFNSVLLNLYEDGKDEIRWHSDKEKQLGESPIIPVINLGASRILHFRSIKENDNYQKALMENGDLLIMKENCQKNWLHAILKEKEVKTPRISLTFRKVFETE